jgi:hypothetical protein
MSTALTSAATAQGLAIRSERPQFVGMLRGEIFKLVRQRFNWLTTLGFAGAVSIYYLFLLGNKSIKDGLQQAPYENLYHLMAREGAIAAVSRVQAVAYGEIVATVSSQGKYLGSRFSGTPRTSRQRFNSIIR